MKTTFLVIGKTNFDYLKEGIPIYKKRLQHYLSFEMMVIPDIKQRKKLSEAQIKQKEGEEVLKKIKSGDYLILLDEKGKSFSSVGFAHFLEKRLQHSSKRLVFLIGGAYGFSETVYKRANAQISLSKMTFSHQMVRLIFLEQLYRAMTILKGEPYHHE